MANSYVDPYLNDVVLLLHGNGTNGSTTITDEKGHTVTAIGSAKLDTSKKKFGTASIACDTAGGNNSWVKVDSHADFAIGTADFTIECWFYPQDNYNSTVLFMAGNSWRFRFYGGYFYWDGPAVSAAATPNNNAWNHFAITRQGNVIRPYLNGVLITSAWTSTTNLVAGDIYVGGDSGNSAQALYGWIDDVRITKGLARYSTSSITAPTQEFGDVYAAPPAGVLSATLTGATLSGTGSYTPRTFGKHDTGYALNAITLSQSVADTVYGLDAYAETEGAHNHVYSLNTYQVRIGKQDVGYVLPAINPTVYGFSEQTYSLTAYQALRAQIDSAYALNTYQTLQGAQDSGYSLTNITPLQSVQQIQYALYDALSSVGYTSAGYALNAYAVLQGKAHSDYVLNSTELVVSAQESRYALQAWVDLSGKHSAGYVLNSIQWVTSQHAQAYALPIFQTRYALADSQYALNAFELRIASHEGTYALLAAEAFAVWAVNLATGAVSRYVNYPFTSFAHDGTRLLATGEDGIYELTGEDDHGTQIASLVDTGPQTFGTDYQKRLVAGYVCLANDGPVNLEVSTDDGVVVDYQLQEQGQLRPRKLRLSRGQVGSYHRIRLTNYRGANFELDSLEFAPEVTTRRRTGTWQR